ncbi:MAG: twin-arginine translocase subunit TatC [Alphaproteobacteria bacterium]|nr:twin-arginine translocase subunit TatC [Alphaproteobacteria bacterium]
MSDTPNNTDLLSHLEELRHTLIRCFIAIGVILPLTLFLAPTLLDILIKYLIKDLPITLNFFSPMEIFILQLKTALLLDLLICFPYIAKQLWNFILPALYDHERRFIKSIVISSSTLFIIGVAFCLFFILPLIIRFGASYATAEINALFGISNIVSLSLRLSVIFGIMFQFPLITYALIKANIITYNTVKSKRPYIFTLILIMSALLTPPDIISQLMLTLPTYILFELGLYFAKKLSPAPKKA